MSFDLFQLHPDLLRGVAALGFQTPTPIQKDSIPPAMAGEDLLACAMTGSGKTAAFALPILHRLLGKSRGRTRALVLSPTRELAAQIDEHFKQLASHTRLSSAAVYGGVSMGPQERAFREGVDIIVATPGRLLDHMRFPYASFAALEILVLDEADRMLDMGFLPDIRRVLSHLPKERQTLFFSATMPDPIVALSREMLRNPKRIDIGRRAAPATGVKQSIFPVREELKPALLVALLERGEIRSAIAFTRTKHRANRLADLLVRAGIDAVRIHGNRSQAQRTDALEGLKEGRHRVLVATDIAARGIDVEALSHVVNVDVPHIPEDYIHRVGRTARAGAVGEAFTFVSPDEEGDLRAIEKAVGKRLNRVILPNFDYAQKATERFEVPIGERIAEIRKRKAEERARAKEKAERKAKAETERLAKAEAAAKSKAETKARAEARPKSRPRPQPQAQSQAQSQAQAKPRPKPQPKETMSAAAEDPTQRPARRRPRRRKKRPADTAAR